MTISLFGNGFVGGAFAKTYPDEVEIVPRDDIYYRGGDILYTISTIHNYHPKEGDPFKDINTNLVHFMKVLDANINEDVVFNFVSSWFVYGNTKIPAKEDSPCNPTGFYSITKYAAELLLKSYCDTFGLKYRILRLANVIGTGDTKASAKKNALQWMIKTLSKEGEISVYEGGAVRDYIDIRDCVDAIHLVLEKGELNQIYNISNGRGYNVSELIDIARREGGYKGKVGKMDVPDFHKVVQVKHMYLDNSKIKSLGYAQKHDIKETVKGLVHHYQNEG